MNNQTIRTSVPALDKTVRVCNYLFSSPGATFSQIQQDLDLPKSSTSSLLNALVEHHLLRQERGRFFLGLKLYEWGNRSLEQFDISKVARPVLEKLRDSTDLICHLGILDEVAPIYILKLESTQPIGIRTWVGKSCHSIVLELVRLYVRGYLKTSLTHCCLRKRCHDLRKQLSLVNLI